MAIPLFGFALFFAIPLSGILAGLFLAIRLARRNRAG